MLRVRRPIEVSPVASRPGQKRVGKIARKAFFVPMKKHAAPIPSVRIQVAGDFSRLRKNAYLPVG
jgi:hypothetical protein